MNGKIVKVKELADELGMTVANINIQISRGHAGEVTKMSEGETSDYSLTIDNILKLLKWLQLYGRGNKLLLMKTMRKYKEFQTN